MPNRHRIATTLIAFVFVIGISSALHAATIGDVCRVKGQEGFMLHGTGLVVGLPGTGDGANSTAQALAKTMMLLGTPIPGGADEELKNLKNIALVYVTASIPPTGAREGGRLTVRVSAMGSASLEGGQLLGCALVGPIPRDPRAFAFAHGSITIEDPAKPTVGVVQGGARLTRSVATSFHDHGYVTLVIDNKHAGFSMAQELEYAINEDKEFEGQNLAKAIDAKTVVARIPESYRDAPVLFVTALENIPLDLLPRERRVVINERSGVIVVGDRVEIRPVAISHKNLTIEVGGNRVNQFTPLDPSADTGVESLKSLVTALNAMQVRTDDMIEIIKTLDREGALYGKLIIQ